MSITHKQLALYCPNASAGPNVQDPMGVVQFGNAQVAFQTQLEYVPYIHPLLLAGLVLQEKPLETEILQKRIMSK